MATKTVQVHHGELIELVTAHLAKEGMTPMTPIAFRFVTGRSKERGAYTWINDGGAYLTAECEVSSPASTATDATEPPPAPRGEGSSGPRCTCRVHKY